MAGDMAWIVNPKSHNEDTSRAMETCNGKIHKIVADAFAHVLTFDEKQDEPLVVKLLRSGKLVERQVCPIFPLLFL